VIRKHVRPNTIAQKRYILMSLTGKKFTVPHVTALRRLVNETRARARARGTRLWIMWLSRSRGTRNALNTPWRNIATRGRDSIASRIAKYLNESGNFYSGCQISREKSHEQIALPESRIQACSHESGTEIGGRSFVTTRVLKLVYRSELRNSGRELANFARSWTQ